MDDTVNKEVGGANKKDVNLDIAKDVQGDTSKEAGVNVKKIADDEKNVEGEKESTEDEIELAGNEKEPSDGEQESMAVVLYQAILACGTFKIYRHLY